MRVETMNYYHVTKLSKKSGLNIGVLHGVSVIDFSFDPTSPAAARIFTGRSHDRLNLCDLCDFVVIQLTGDATSPAPAHTATTPSQTP